MRGPVVVVVLALVLAGCSPGSSDHATIEVDHPVSLADQAVHLKVSGLKAGESGPPYLPRGTSGLHPVLGQVLQYGGTRQINESALLQGWTKTLELLKSLAG